MVSQSIWLHLFLVCASTSFREDIWTKALTSVATDLVQDPDVGKYETKSVHAWFVGKYETTTWRPPRIHSGSLSLQKLTQYKTSVIWWFRYETKSVHALLAKYETKSARAWFVGKYETTTTWPPPRIHTESTAKWLQISAKRLQISPNFNCRRCWRRMLTLRSFNEN